MDIYCCLVSTISEVCKILSCQEQSVVNAFYLTYDPYVKKLHLSKSFHSSSRVLVMT